ncbi:hypothetical protein [Streptomyces sp. NPDC002057]|uniref:hypothetical protein n=1 Tax=Streptomyces sp. NPDC002057 TaxID=3154664 RepID=UPI003318B1A8
MGDVTQTEDPARAWTTEGGIKGAYLCVDGVWRDPAAIGSSAARDRAGAGTVPGGGDDR